MKTLPDEGVLSRFLKFQNAHLLVIFLLGLFSHSLNTKNVLEKLKDTKFTQAVHFSLSLATVHLNKPQKLRATEDAATGCILDCKCLHKQTTAQFKGSANNRNCNGANSW